MNCRAEPTSHTPRLKILIAALVVFAFGLDEARAESSPFTEDNQRIMLVHLSDGLKVADAIIAYPDGTEWYLPLGELTADLGIAINVAAEDGKADGFILDERRTFHLDLKACHADIGGFIQDFPCNQARKNEGDIFVTITLLQKWLPLRFFVNSFSSEIVITPSKPLPAQERAERERRAKSLMRGGGAYDPGYPLKIVPNSNLEGPFIDQQWTFNSDHSRAETAGSVRQDTILSGEVLGMESSVYVGGLTNKFERTRVSMAKRSPMGDLLGPVHARDVELLDVNLPTLPVIGGGGLGTGAMISTFPLTSPDNYSTQTLQGDLPSGWEVELYQNDTLINRQVSNLSGRYEFSNVPLFYGINRFRLIFYGPQGQRRETTKLVNVGRTLQTPGSTDYRIATGQISSDEQRTLLQADTGLSNALTLHAGAARIIPTKQTTYSNYGLLGLSAQVGPTVLQNTAVASQTGGTAFETGVQGAVDRTTFGLSHTFLKNFSSDLFQAETNRSLIGVSRVEVAAVPFVQPALRTTAEENHKFYDNSDQSDEIVQRTTLLTGKLFWNNELTYTIDGSHSIAGLFSTSLLLAAAQVRFFSNYSDHSVQTAAIDSQANVAINTSIRGAFTQHLQEQYGEMSASLSRTFDAIVVTLNTTYSTLSDWSVGAVLSYSLAHDPVASEWHMSSQSVTGTGAASVHVFLDQNRNGVYDPGEKSLKGIGLQVSQRDIPGKTDENGRLFVQQLPAQQPADMSVNIATLIDPMLKPLTPGVRFFPRAGKTVEVDIPVQTFSDFSGTIVFPGHLKRGIEVVLLNEKHDVVSLCVAESDGFYIFERVAPGNYEIEIRPSTIHGTARITPSLRKVVAQDDGTSLGDLDFVLDEGQ